MNIKIYNTLSKQKEEFIPINEGKVSMYVCGVTVYDKCHIGHARAYVVFDIIRRYLEYRGLEVNYIQNFTDVDDKILNRAKKLGITPKQLSTDIIKAYFDSMDQLNIKRANDYPKVTENIGDIIKFIKELIAKGAAYDSDGDVFFEVNSFEQYGKLSGRKLEDMKAGARVEINKKKKNPMDFALWKKDEDGDLNWNSPWGKGRPGWHIECSVMSKKKLGLSFDIHGGGNDLIFPHHENEIAQSESLSGKPMANYWIHNGFVKINKEKMSKSLGNFFTIDEVLKTVEPMVLRLFFLMTQYRMPINYSDQELNETTKALHKIRDALYLNDVDGEVNKKEIKDLRSEFIEAMDDDFNTARAVAVVFKTVKLVNTTLAKDAIEFLKELLDVLGLNIDPKMESIAPEIIDLAEERLIARMSKDWAKSDELRDKIQSLGYAVKDTKDGYSLDKIN